MKTEKLPTPALLLLAEHLAEFPYSLTPDQWASEARCAIAEHEKLCQQLHGSWLELHKQILKYLENNVPIAYSYAPSEALRGAIAKMEEAA